MFKKCKHSKVHASPITTICDSLHDGGVSSRSGSRLLSSETFINSFEAILSQILREM